MGSIETTSPSGFTGPSSLHSAIHALATAYTLSQEKARDEGPSALSSICTPACRRYIRPVSLLLQPPGHLVQSGETNSEYAERWMLQLEQTSRARAVEILDIVIDEPRLKAVTRHIHYIKHKNGEKEFPFEVVSFLDVNATGEKIEKIVQVLDTQMAESFWRENRGVQERVKAKLKAQRERQQSDSLRRGSLQSSLVGALGNSAGLGVAAGNSPTTPTSRTPKFERTYSWKTEGQREEVEA